MVNGAKPPIRTLPASYHPIGFYCFCLTCDQVTAATQVLEQPDDLGLGVLIELVDQPPGASHAKALAGNKAVLFAEPLVKRKFHANLVSPCIENKHQFHHVFCLFLMASK